jgi:hypothetical protein
VHGLELDDGRCVASKAHADRSQMPQMRTRLEAATRLAARALPLPACLVEPSPIGLGYAWIEPFLEGLAVSAHVAGVTELLARLVVDLGGATDALADLTLPRMFFFADPRSLWPAPHSPLFDFEATASGAEWIDVIARPARERSLRSTSPFVVGHHDVRVEHVRFDANPPSRITALFDTDSPCRERETHLVGLAAMMFTVDFHERRTQAPSIAQMRGFVDACEMAWGARFTNDAREEIDAMMTYAVPYAVRCGHALRERDETGYPELLREIVNRTAR